MYNKKTRSDVVFVTLSEELENMSDSVWWWEKNEKVVQLGPHIFPTHNAMVQWFWQFNTNLNEHTPEWKKEKSGETRNYLPKTSKHVMNDNQNTLKESCQKKRENFLSNFPLARFLFLPYWRFLLLLLFSIQCTSAEKTRNQSRTPLFTFLSLSFL